MKRKLFQIGVIATLLITTPVFVAGCSSSDSKMQETTGKGLGALDNKQEIINKSQKILDKGQEAVDKTSEKLGDLNQDLEGKQSELKSQADQLLNKIKDTQ